MQASVEISMYPLGREYVPEIKNFIENLKKHKEITVETNGMSTQIFGAYREIMQILTNEIEASFVKFGKSVFVLKIVNAHLQKQS